MKTLQKICFILFPMVLAMNSSYGQSVYLATGGKASFFSATSMENIDAVTQSMTGVLTAATNDVIFTVPLRTFKFKSALMEEHFNEKYVESEKYPKSTFKGKINEKIDWTRDTIATVTATGDMTLHGVTKTTTETGKLTIKEGKINLEVVIDVALKDYNIEVPKIVTQSIAEVIKVTMNCTFVPYVKKG